LVEVVLTTVAWDGKTLASDSMSTGPGGFYRGKVKKLFHLKSGGIMGQAGDADCRAIIQLLDSIKDGADLPSRAELEATRTDGDYILVLPDKSAWNVSIAYDGEGRFFGEVSEIREKFYAIGHGEDIAFTVMSLGLSSVEAIKEACKWSAVSRGPIQTLKLDEKPKEKIKRVRKPKDPIEANPE
jgi:hypothetical protein